jgi:membrane protein implicated in regulation of membrane protease activity
MSIEWWLAIVAFVIFVVTELVLLWPWSETR